MSGVGIVPESGIGNLFFEFGQLFNFRTEVKDGLGDGRAWTWLVREAP